MIVTRQSALRHIKTMFSISAPLVSISGISILHFIYLKSLLNITRIGMIIGTGTNACYLEDIDRVDTWDGDKGDPKHVIINTEWGAFGTKASKKRTAAGAHFFVLRENWISFGPSGTSWWTLRASTLASRYSRR